jgi:hypothetical protein
MRRAPGRAAGRPAMEQPGGSLEAVPQNQEQGQALPLLVGAGGGLGCLRGGRRRGPVSGLGRARARHGAPAAWAVGSTARRCPSSSAAGQRCGTSLGAIGGATGRRDWHGSRADGARRGGWPGVRTKTPPSLSSIQCLGAFSLFMCFLGPRTISTRASRQQSEQAGGGLLHRKRAGAAGGRGDVGGARTHFGRPHRVCRGHTHVAAAAASSDHSTARPSPHPRSRSAATQRATKMLLLFETAAGFALFKVLKEGKLKEADDLSQDFESLESAQKVRRARPQRPSAPIDCRLPRLSPCPPADRQAQGIQQVREHRGGAGRGHRAGGLQAQQGWVQRGAQSRRCLRARGPADPRGPTQASRSS